MPTWAEQERWEHIAVEASEEIVENFAWETGVWASVQIVEDFAFVLAEETFVVVFVQTAVPLLVVAAVWGFAQIVGHSAFVAVGTFVRTAASHSFVAVVVLVCIVVASG